MIKTSEIGNSSFLKMTKQALLEGANFSAVTVAVLSTLIFFIYISFYCALVYVQFTYVEIFKVVTLFLGLFLGILFVFQPWIFKSQIKLGWPNIFWSTLVSLGLLALINSPNPLFFDYFRTFPLLEAELGLGWNSDSAFHVSVINSFNTFGFPSVAQNDTPLMVYHVLSHFVDAILVRIAGVDAWDSYGLFYYLKTAMLLSSIVLFVASVCRDKKNYVFILSLVFLIPVVVGTWHAVGSHGLWFTSLIIILSSTFVFNVLTKKDFLSYKEYTGLFFLLVIVSMGKVSSGLSYSALIGFSIFLTDYKRVRVYAFGASLLAFFSVYSLLITGGEGVASFSGLRSIKDFILLDKNILYHQLYQVYILIAILGIAAWIFRSITLGKLFLGGVMSVVVVAIIVSMQPNFSSTDIWYFVYGLSSVLLLLVYQSIVFAFSEKEARNVKGLINFNNKFAKIVLVSIIVLLTYQLNKPSLNIFNVSFGSINNVVENFDLQPFSNINNYDALNASTLKQAQGTGLESLAGYSRPLSGFKEELDKFMDKNALSAKDTLLYVPEEIFVRNFDQFRGHSWARGMLVYAVTGVPLIHGIEARRRTYGYSEYDESALWVERTSFDELEACRFGKSIIVVENFEGAEFTLIDC